MDDSIKLSFCPECGLEIKHTYRFCANCGADFEKWVNQLEKEEGGQRGVIAEGMGHGTSSPTPAPVYTPTPPVEERPYFKSAPDQSLFLQEEIRKQLNVFGLLLVGFLGRFILVNDAFPDYKTFIGATVIIVVTSFIHILSTKNYAYGEGVIVRLQGTKNSYLNSVILNSFLLGVYPTSYDLSEGDNKKYGKVLGVEALIGLGIAIVLLIIPTFDYYPRQLKLLMVTFYCTYVLIKMIPTPWTPGQLIRQWNGLISFGLTIGSILLLTVLVGFS